VKLERKDALIVAAITAAFFIFATYDLGQIRTPSNPWRVQQETFILNLDSNHTVDSICLYTQSDANATASFAVPRGDGWADKAWLNSDGYYYWLRVKFGQTTDRIKVHFYLPAGDIFEIAVVADDGSLLTVKSITSDTPSDTTCTNLVDEQALVETPLTCNSEMVFDEELFVRAAKQMLDGQDPTAEDTHPPLGKLIMAVGLVVFGFNPFGWRIMGVVFAALMIPVIYCLGYALFKTRAAATMAAAFIALDFMHFTMARMGTVDTYLVFFILLSTLFFYLNYEKMAVGGKPDYKLIVLALFCFSAAFSVKWIAIFGFVGEAVLFLALGLFGQSPIKGVGNRLRALAKPILIIACLVPTIGAVVYFGSYIPYMSHGHSLADVWAEQWKMLGFHSEMTYYDHPNSTDWWEWPITLSPLWLYTRELPGGLHSSISAMGNPVLWWVGLVAIILAIVEGAQRKWHQLFLGVLYLAQLLPYTFISRFLFIYHYYAEVPLLCLALAGLLHEMWYTPKQRRYIVVIFVVAVAFLAAFYPVISGMVIPQGYTAYLHWFRDWRF